ncbi:MAG: glutamine synthetase [Pseudolabrys sp.]|nr:glutamine synthetase [Pseudolabrys sp.]
MTSIARPRTAEEILTLLRERDIDRVKVGIADVDGILRGKYMSREKFESSLNNGFAFCDVVLGWDSNDQLYDNTKLTGWHTAYPDAPVRLLPETARLIPYENGTPFVLAEFDGYAEGACPRGVLRRVLKKARDMGFAVSAAAEFEFFLFQETPHSIREKDYRALQAITPGFFGYSLLRAGLHAEFYHELLDLCRDMDFPLEGLHTETGAGVVEAAICVDDALSAADKAVLFKTFVKILAQRRGWIATFMAKWSRDWPGQSGHLHVSLQDIESGRGIFYAADRSGTMSDEMRWFVGGQRRLMPELLAMVACTVNSYTRLVPGYWAPTEATWGIENRTTALRVIPGSEKSQRVEYRVAAADINPYIALAAVIGSGLWGIEHGIDPGDPVRGNAYELKHAPDSAFPRTLGEAATRLKASEPARQLFGDTFVDHFCSTREWEQRQANKAITDWQLARYFEII